MAAVWIFADGGREIASAHEIDGEALPLCHLMLGTGEPLFVGDLRKDERLRSHAAVAGSPGLRAFFSAPLKGRTGQRLGMLCVMDTRPRELEPRLQEALSDLAALVAEDLEAQASLH